MAWYEVVRKIENSCERNQMRDVFFDEIETDDPVEAVRALLKDESEAQLHVEEHSAESFTVFAECSGVLQKFLFTKI